MKGLKYIFSFVLIGGIFLFLLTSYFRHLETDANAEHDKAIFTVKRIEFIHSFVRDYLKSCKNIDYNKLDNLAFISDTDFIVQRQLLFPFNDNYNSPPKVKFS